MPKVYRVILTGGPCGGKSSALDSLSKFLTEKGFDVFCVPEIPTILINGGAKYPGAAPENREKLFAFETNLLHLQFAAEDAFYGIAKSLTKDSVIIHDRGLMDIKAYLPDDIWNELLKRNRLTEKALLERYDLVIHLVTAADGAEKFYTTTNNTARRESPEEARELDQKVRTCWKQHKHVEVIKNEGTDFNAKLQKTRDAIGKHLTIK